MKRIVFLLAGLCLLVGATPASADVPPLPHAFYGALEINDGPAPAGTQVEARGDGVLKDTDWNPLEVTEPGFYGGPGALDPKLVVQGDIADGATLTFYVDGVFADTAEWHSGEVTALHLSVTIRRPSGGGGVGGRDTIDPRISYISMSNITETSADISWMTHEKSDSQVEYWSNGHKKSDLDEEMAINHLVHLTGLTPGTTYYYKIMSTDKAGNLGVSKEGTFTTKGKAPAVAFTTDKLSISPGEVGIGQTVTISVTVTNIGTASGSYTVKLKIKGVVEDTRKGYLKAGASQEITFTTAKDAAGSYSVDVNGLSGSFTVKAAPTPPPLPPPPPTPPPAPPTEPEPINWPLVGGIIAGVVVVAVVIFFCTRRRSY